MKSKRKVEYDILRVMACICIIGIHTFKNTSIIGNMLQALFRIGLPMFFFISGSLNLSYDRKGVSNFYKRRFTKILIPYFLYSLIYIIVDIIKSKSFSLSPFAKMLQLPFGVNVHFWFVFSIMGMYLFTPYLSVMCKHLNEKEKKSFVNVLFFVVIVTELLPLFHIELGISSIPFTGYIIYYLLGYFIGCEEVYNDKKYLFYILGFLSYIICSIFGNNGNYGLYDCQITMFFEVISIFLAVKSRYGNNYLKEENKFISIVSKYSYDIYLLHALFVNEILAILIKYNINISSMICGCSLILIVFILSLICGIIVHKILEKVELFFHKICC